MEMDKVVDILTDCVNRLNHIKKYYSEFSDEEKEDVHYVLCFLITKALAELSQNQ